MHSPATVEAAAAKTAEPTEAAKAAVEAAATEAAAPRRAEATVVASATESAAGPAHAAAANPTEDSAAASIEAVIARTWIEDGLAELDPARASGPDRARGARDLRST